MNEKKQRLLAQAALIFATIVWGSGFAVVKNTLLVLRPMWVSTLRFVISTVLMGIIFFKRISKSTKSDVKMGLIAGLPLFFANTAQIVGAQWTSAGKNAFLTSVYVVIVPFLSIIFLKNKVDRYNFFAAFICMGGVGLLTLEKDLSVNIGDVFTLACAVLFALHIITVSRAKDNDFIAITFFQMAVTAALSLLCAALFEGAMPRLTAQVFLATSYLGIFGNMLAFTFQTFAQRHVSASHASLLLSLEAVFGVFISSIALKEKIDLKMLIGCALILSAVVVSETKLAFFKNGTE